ncbi:unnamed protein product [Medioppia subpectinata]|uniref:Uncharacterized protein n=1 Tax=Medioppia subpectinata TaxID=1979941 RepID=A0A7R9PTY3_9ACAR|nr:unnamed protein product [Medioppia subpectinata]CAG2101034.1 unnamed protein product [Medioppia subpectinata]
MEANIKLITEKADNYHNLGFDLNKTGSYLVACPTYKVNDQEQSTSNPNHNDHYNGPHTETGALPESILPIEIYQQKSAQIISQSSDNSMPYSPLFDVGRADGPDESSGENMDTLDHDQISIDSDNSFCHLTGNALFSMGSDLTTSDNDSGGDDNGNDSPSHSSGEQSQLASTHLSLINNVGINSTHNYPGLVSKSIDPLVNKHPFAEGKGSDDERTINYTTDVSQLIDNEMYDILGALKKAHDSAHLECMDEFNNDMIRKFPAEVHEEFRQTLDTALNEEKVSILYGREAEQHLNGHTFDIKHIMGRDVTDDALNRYPFDFVDKRHPKDKVLLYANEVPNSDTYLKYKLSRTDPFPITVRITEGPDLVIKQFIMNKYPEQGFASKHLLESELNVIMNELTKHMNNIGQEWDRHLLYNIDQNHRNKLKLELLNQIDQYKLKNYRNAPGSGNLGIYFERRLLMAGYFDHGVEFVPENKIDIEKKNTQSKYARINNCIAFNNEFLFGRKARDYLTDSSNTEFDVKELLGKDRVDPEKLSQYPFGNWIQNPLRVRLPSPGYSGQVYSLNAETLVALQVLDIKHRAEILMKSCTEKAVFCVPTGYNSKQRRAMRDVGILSGINYVHIINEMTAAALAYVIDSPRKSFAKEFIMIFAIHQDQFECGLIKLGNTLIEHLVYGVVNELNNFSEYHPGCFKDYISKTLDIQSLIMRDLNRVILIGNSKRLTEFKDLIAATFTTEITGKHNIIYKCDPTDVIVKGTVYYGLLMDKRLDTIDIHEIVRADIKLLVHKNNDQQMVKELIPINAKPNSYREANKFLIKLSGNSFPIQLCLNEGDATVKTFKVDKPEGSWAGNIISPLIGLPIQYHMDQSTFDVYITATLKKMVGLRTLVDLADRPERYGLNSQCINAQHKILRELGAFSNIVPVQSTSAPNRIQPSAQRPSATAQRPLARQASTPGTFNAPNPVAMGTFAATSAPTGDRIQEFSKLCADIRTRLETCGAIATKKRNILQKLSDCEKSVTQNVNTLDKQKEELLRLIDKYQLTDKLIIV